MAESNNKFRKGLTDEQINESRQLYGENVIREAEPETFWDKVKEGLSDPMIKLLCAIAGIMIVMYFFGQAEIYEPIGTLIAVALVTLISAKTEMASDDEYRKLKNSTKKETCKVHRNGNVEVINSEELVVGDIVILQSGDKIPADGVLVEGNLKVDNSALNGEAEECKKFAAEDNFKMSDEITGDTFVDKSSLFRGATVYSGEGILEVQKVGMHTMMGKMAEDMQDDNVDSPLKVKLSKLAKQISTFGYIGAIVISIAYFVHFMIVAGGFNAYIATGGISILKDVIEAVTLAIVIIVCAVPEGLPLMISLVLMQNTGKLLQHNVLVRKPIGVETAGSLNILFSDKTGTITKGHLEVVEFFDGSGQTIDIKNVKGLSGIRSNLDLSIGKNTSALYDAEHNVIGGNATDQALLKYLGEETFLKLYEDKDCKVDAQQTFNSANKFSSSYISGVGKTFYKGAPERLLEKATHYLSTEGKEVEIDTDAVYTKIDELANKAMRVLAFGYSKKELVEDTINDDLVIIGLVGIRDDVRPEAIEAIDNVKKAGIQVVMITGDRKETAVAIAKDAGLLDASKGDLALTSEELNKMSDDDIKQIVNDIRVIARALPTDKSRMARICQELGLVVGMSGDGVNDAPALKRADVGFAMGSGTSVAKEAGDIVILDDNFKSIKDAILYGRTIYHNILKFCKFQLSINVAAVGVSALLPFFGIEEALTVTHLLFVNLIMDSLGALLLGNEPALEKYMSEKPRQRDESIVSKEMFMQFAFMGLYIIAMSIAYFKVDNVRTLFNSEEQYMTGYFAMFMFMSILNAFNVRSDSFRIFEKLTENKNFIKVLVSMLGATVLLTIIGGEMFKCTAFGLNGWSLVCVAGLTVIPVDMLRKLITGCKSK